MPAHGFVILTLAFRQEGRRWTGECLELGTATYARTLRQTRDELLSMTSLHLAALEDVGERDRFFREHGIRFYTDDAPSDGATSQVPVDDEAFFQAHRVAVGDLVASGRA